MDTRNSNGLKASISDSWPAIVGSLKNINFALIGLFCVLVVSHSDQITSYCCDQHIRLFGFSKHVIVLDLNIHF